VNVTAVNEVIFSTCTRTVNDSWPDTEGLDPDAGQVAVIVLEPVVVKYG